MPEGTKSVGDDKAGSAGEEAAHGFLENPDLLFDRYDRLLLRCLDNSYILVWAIAHRAFFFDHLSC
jgi:hypothetical protein